MSASGVDGGVNDGNATVDSSPDSTLVSDSNDDTFGDAMSTPPPVRASARNAVNRLIEQRRHRLI